MVKECAQAEAEGTVRRKETDRGRQNHNDQQRHGQIVRYRNRGGRCGTVHRRLARMGVWKSDMVGCGRAGPIGGRTKEGMLRAKACRIHEHLSTTVAGNIIGGPWTKDLSVALPKCPNLHTLNLSGQ